MEQVASPARKRQPALAVAKVNGLNEPLIVQVVEGIARNIQVVFRHDPKRADGGKCPAVFAVWLVDPITVHGQRPIRARRRAAGRGRASRRPEDRIYSDRAPVRFAAVFSA
jgi:hypothetical protein